jgi:hypothetical protein
VQARCSRFRQGLPLLAAGAYHGHDQEERVGEHP